jgi:hypothetical protein
MLNWTMTTPRSRPAASIYKSTLRGIGELFAFLGAGVYAVFCFCIGRWPDERRLRRQEQLHPARHASEKPIASKSAD